MNKQQKQVIQEWYDQYFSFLFLLLMAHFRKRNIKVKESEVEDLVQNTFLALLERKKDTPIAHPKAYLRQAALSQARMFLDKKMRQGFPVAPEIALQNRVAQNARTNLERKEEEQVVWRIMAGVLNQLEQSIVYKRVVQGYSYKEIAAEDDMPKEQYLPTLFHRAKSKLFNHLKKRGYDKPAS